MMEPAELAMAAAVAAAAELAKNGGMSLYPTTNNNNNSNSSSNNAGHQLEHNESAAHATKRAKTDASSWAKKTANEKGPNQKARNDTQHLVPNQSPKQERPSGTTEALTTMRHMTEGNISSSSSATTGTATATTSAGDTENDDEEEETEEDAEKRLARSRERNREHARRTRLRKKAQLEALQRKAKGLEDESRLLKQSLEECSIASILVGLSSSDQRKSHDPERNQQLHPAGLEMDSLLNIRKLQHQQQQQRQHRDPKMSLIVSGKRKRFISEDAVEKPPQPLKLNIDGHITLIGGGKTHINWKSGVYCDESGQQKQLTQEQLETLRRERNRMHAKMTRDRKKCYIAGIEKTIEQLESNNQKMRDALSRVAQQHFGSRAVTPVSSPMIASVPATSLRGNGGMSPLLSAGNSGPDNIEMKLGSSAMAPQQQQVTTSKSIGSNKKDMTNVTGRVPHGFSLSVP